MNPADIAQFRHALAIQGALIGEHSHTLQESIEAILGVSANITPIGGQLNVSRLTC